MTGGFSIIYQCRIPHGRQTYQNYSFNSVANFSTYIFKYIQRRDINIGFLEYRLAWVAWFQQTHGK